MLRGLLAVIAGLAAASCGSGKLEAQDEAVRATWAEVRNEFQRRADLVPDLLERLQAAATVDAGMLEVVRQAGAAAAAYPLSSGLLHDLEEFARMYAAQAELGRVLQDLLASTDQQASLAVDETYRDLRARIRESQRRIAEDHQRFAGAVQEYNATIRRFPTSITAGLLDFHAAPEHGDAVEGN